MAQGCNDLGNLAAVEYGETGLSGTSESFHCYHNRPSCQGVNSRPSGIPSRAMAAPVMSQHLFRSGITQ
ncbi:UNVERIFIED_CONTAM: hypothetical protein FKN15_043489 [Acipenser sinensis]